MDHWETEIKVHVTRPTHLKKRLRALGATLVQRRHFEENEILDFKDGRIRKARSLVRLRRAEGAGYLAFKGPKTVRNGFKSRREIEISLANPDALREILRAVGLETTYRYEKYRTVFRMGRTLITLDETPIGVYAEVEGSPTAIRRMATRLGFEPKQFITATYFDLHKRYLRENRLATRHMRFNIARSSRP
ncbi:MAG TPA: class IV adenylate cyclase [Candidatus Polarisedimenticolia bacterium]|nr:class IV adenylate cyclase [Candidatus Polarisedimenticolia bacterium]